jgi:hypothetical protein
LGDSARDATRLQYARRGCVGTGTTMTMPRSDPPARHDARASAADAAAAGVPTRESEASVTHHDGPLAAVNTPVVPAEVAHPAGGEMLRRTTLFLTAACSGTRGSKMYGACMHAMPSPPPCSVTLRCAVSVLTTRATAEALCSSLTPTHGAGRGAATAVGKSTFDSRRDAPRAVAISPAGCAEQKTCQAGTATTTTTAPAAFARSGATRGAATVVETVPVDSSATRVTRRTHVAANGGAHRRRRAGRPTSEPLREAKGGRGRGSRCPPPCATPACDATTSRRAPPGWSRWWPASCWAPTSRRRAWCQATRASRSPARLRQDTAPTYGFGYDPSFPRRHPSSTFQACPTAGRMDVMLRSRLTSSVVHIVRCMHGAYE